MRSRSPALPCPPPESQHAGAAGAPTQPTPAGAGAGVGVGSPPRVDDMISNVAYTVSLLCCGRNVVRTVWEPGGSLMWHRRAAIRILSRSTESDQSPARLSGLRELIGPVKRYRTDKLTLPLR